MLRRLLDDESAILAQLSYVVMNLHNPILENCDPLYNKLLPEVHLRSLHIVAPRTGNPAPSFAGSGSCAKDHNGEGSSSSPAARILPPQPAVVRRGSSPAPPSGASSSNQGGKRAQDRRTAPTTTGGRNGAKNTLGSHHTAGREAANVLAFSEYWELFANLPTLYEAQSRLVETLERTVRDVTALLDRLQNEQELAELDTDDANNEGCVNEGEASEDDGVRREKEVEEVRVPRVSILSPSSPNAPPIPLTRQSNIPPRSRKPFGATTTFTENDALRTLGSTVCAFFTSEEMSRVMAEHAMYTVNYTSKAAPLVLELGRLWRRGGGGGAPLNGMPAPAAKPLSPSDRATLLHYSKFFDFLLRSFGHSGVPNDSRIVMSSLPEVASTSAAQTVGDGPGGVAGKHHHSPRQLSSEFPPLPPMWNGFHTLVMLLSTPLSCLRRYLHVARCFVESCAVPRDVRLKLQTGFIDRADVQVVEEGVLTMEELAEQDVRTIMRLIEDSSSANISGADGAATGESGASLLSQFRNPSRPRVLVHYGRLYKRSGRGRHERLMFLFTDWICYVEELRSGRMRLRGAMPLDTLRVIDVADSPAMDIINCFELTNAQTKCFSFFASTPEQKRQWVDAIRFAVRQHTQAQLRAKLGATSAPGNSSAAAVTAAAAAAAASTGIFQTMKPKNLSTTLPHRSRLCRQRRCDQMLQDYLDASHVVVGSCLPSLGTSVAASGVRGGGASLVMAANTPSALHAATDSFGQLQTSQSAVSAVGSGGGGAHHSRSSSFGQSRSASAHRQLEYDVTQWSRQSATHRRLRGNQDLVLSAPVTPAAALASSSHSSMSSLECKEKEGSSNKDGPHEGEKRPSTSAGSRPNAKQEEASPGSRGKDHGSSSDTPAATAADDLPRSFKVPPGASLSFPTSIPRPPSKTDSVGGASSSSRPPIPTTPLRRPVLERFEVAQSSPLPCSPCSQRTSSLHNDSSSGTRVQRTAAVPPRVPPPSLPSSLPRAHRDTSADPSPLVGTGRDKREGERSPNSAKEEVDSQLSSLIKASDSNREGGSGGSEIDLGSTDSRFHSAGSAGGSHGSRKDGQGVEGEDEEGTDDDDEDTGSASLIEDYDGFALETPGGHASSEDGVGLPSGDPLSAYEADPTTLDDEAQAVAALMAFRVQRNPPPGGSSTPSMLYKPQRQAEDTPGSGTPAVGWGGGSGDPGMSGRPLPGSPPSQRYMDPSRDLETLFQQDEAQEAKEAESREAQAAAEGHCDDRRGNLDSTDDGTVEFDQAEKEGIREFMGTPDTSPDLSEDVPKAKKHPTGKKKKK